MVFIMFILLCFTFVKCGETNQAEDKLIYVQIIFRHGDRTIRKTYPNDPYKDKLHWPEGFAQLTNYGKQQQFSLGEYFRRRYGAFLGKFAPDKISVLSSDLDRTINSANLVLAGLFPPDDNQIWNSDLLWNPIPVHTVPVNIDHLITGEKACKLYLKKRDEYENSTEIRTLKEEHHELFEYLEKHSGQPVQTLEHLKDLQGTLDVEHRLNKTLPDWTRKVFYPGGAFEYLADYWLVFSTATTELKRLKCGFLLKEIFDRFTSKALSLLPDHLMYIYSGHDITLGGVLNWLGVFQLHLPPYASSLLFELYAPADTDSSHYVKIFYRNTTTEELEPITIPNCGEKCPLTRLYEIYDDILPSSDPETECRLPTE